MRDVNNSTPTPIIVLNWNGFDDTVECIDGLLRQTYTNYVVHLIDNGSDSDDFDRLSDRYGYESKIRIRANADNLGFTRGVNQELQSILRQEPRPGEVALLNNDAVPAPDWLENLLLARASSGREVIASRMVSYHQHDQLDNAGHIWLDTGEILPRGPGQPTQSFDEPADLVGACAGAALYSTHLIGEIGLFDPFFQTGYEDAEFGLRAFLAGYPTRYEPKAVVFHKISQSVDKIRSPAYAVKIQTNINYTYLKLAPVTLMIANGPFIAIKTIGVILVAALTLRRRIIYAHVHALIETVRSLRTIKNNRRSVAHLRRIPVASALAVQVFFLPRYLDYFRRFILTGKKTVFEK